MYIAYLAAFPYYNWLFKNFPSVILLSIEAFPLSQF